LRVTKSDPAEFLPTSVQKSYFKLSRSARAVLDTALRKYRPGRSDLIPVGGIAQLKPALELMTAYRLMIQEVAGAEVVTAGEIREIAADKETAALLERFSGDPQVQKAASEFDHAQKLEEIFLKDFEGQDFTSRRFTMSTRRV
jgi:hypothetical protein